MNPRAAFTLAKYGNIKPREVTPGVVKDVLTALGKPPTDEMSVALAEVISRDDADSLADFLAAPENLLAIQQAFMAEKSRVPQTVRCPHCGDTFDLVYEGDVTS